MKKKNNNMTNIDTEISQLDYKTRITLRLLKLMINGRLPNIIDNLTNVGKKPAFSLSTRVLNDFFTLLFDYRSIFNFQVFNFLSCFIIL